MFTVFGIVGLIVISRAIWFRDERTQDKWFVIGGILLLVYSASRHDVIFTILQIVFIVSALLELKKLK